MTAVQRLRLRPLGALIGALLGVTYEVSWPPAAGLALLAALTLSVRLVRRRSR